MTHSSTGDWMFIAIGVLYLASWLTHALGYVSLRGSAGAAMVTSGWLTVWSVVYGTWWSVAFAVSAVVFFAWEWDRASKAESGAP